MKASHDKRTQLEERLRLSLTSRDVSGTIPRRSTQASIPLSFAQERLWFLDKLVEGVPLYHEHKAIQIKGPLSIEILLQTLNAMVARHEVLRTTFLESDGTPRQVVNEKRPVDLPLFDLSKSPIAEQEIESHRLVQQEITRQFDLSRDSMLRAALLRLQQDEHILLPVIHHIAFDGWSMSILVNELSALYEAFSNGDASPLPDLRTQYADFAIWQRQRLQGEFVENHLKYWNQQLSGDLPTLDLPTDHSRPAIQTHRGKRQSATFSNALLEEIKTMSRREGVTLFVTLLSAFKILLYRYTSQEDIVVGSPSAGRNRVEIEDLIGLFVNTNVLRTKLSDSLTFRQVLGRVRTVTLEALAHQELPFELLVANLQPDRNLSFTPLFLAVFQLRNMPRGEFKTRGIEMGEIEVESQTAKFDLTLEMTETADGLQCEFEYSTDLFDDGTITRMLGHLRTLLESVPANPNECISNLPMLTEEEKHQILVEWNETDGDFPRDECIHELFETQVQQRPDAVAVSCGDQRLAYRELNNKANRLAHYLRELGIAPDTIVGVCVERSVEMVVAILAILKAGGAYLPLDPDYPKERLAFMLDDANAPVLLTKEYLIDRLPPHKGRTFCLDSDWNKLAQYGSDDPINNTTPDNLAYVIYTSGSTGKPKGVAIHHRAVNHLLINNNYAQLHPDDVIAQISNFSFDAAPFEIWGALLHGAHLVIIPKDIVLSPVDFAAQLDNQRITAMLLTTALFNLMAKEVPAAFKNLRHLLFGGEAADPRWVRRVLQDNPPQRLLNVYGPTEATTFASFYLVRSVAEGAANVPIGKPIASSRIYLLDQHLNPVPIGIHGEIYIGGPGVARGYLNRPELTAERFIPNPFSKVRGDRLYKTGDLARYRPNGDIEFLGRIDQLVKIRGFRIEPGEIESILSQYPEVQEAIVMVQEDQSGEKRLVAYVVADQASDYTPSILRESLKEKLPDYMIPSAFVFLDSLPLTQNGKVDLGALPIPDNRTDPLDGASVGPRNSVELELIKIWVTLLGVKEIGVRDNFFGLGGHSLLAVQLFSMIEHKFGRRLPLSSIFEGATVEHLAKLLDGGRTMKTSSCIVPIQPTGSKPPLYIMNMLGDIPLGFRNLAPHLGPDQPVYAFRLQGIDDIRPSKTRIEDIATFFIREIIAMQPQGPYYLGGFSGGGVVAFEAAQQLQAQGLKVGLLALFDSGCPGYDGRLPLLQRYWFHVSQLVTLDRNGKVRYAKALSHTLKDKIRRMVLQIVDRLHLNTAHPRAGSFLDAVLVDAYMVNLMSFKHYVPRAYTGRTTLFWANDNSMSTSPRDSRPGWSELAAGGLDIREIPGTHVTILAEPNVKILADQLRSCLEKAQVEEG